MRTSLHFLQIALLCLALASCATNQQRLAEAAATRAVAEASVELPPLPAECHIDTLHAPRQVGLEADDAVRAERRRTDWANASKRKCVAFYDDVRAGLARRPH